MYPCVETIRIVDGQLPPSAVWALHQERVARTCRELYGVAPFDLREALAAPPLPETLRSGTVKCRILYGPTGCTATEYAPYRPPRIGSLLAVVDDSLEYRFKYSDRSSLTAWHERAVAAGCDDALLIRRGEVTDTTFCNVAFRVAESPSEWHTPAAPLLCGTMRERLLQTGRIVPRKIRLSTLTSGRYDRVALFNTMNDFGSMTLPMQQLHIATTCS